MMEAARLEGCSGVQNLQPHRLPLCHPGRGDHVIFNFVACWNNYMGPHHHVQNGDVHHARDDRYD